jgi:hypothetical protein
LAAFTKANAAFDTANTANSTDYTTISITAGTHGNAIYVPVVTVTANGRISSISNTAITGFANATFAQANLASAMVNVNKIDFGSGGHTITMTQSTAPGIRAMTGVQNQIQFTGSHNGTISHAAISQNLGFFRESGSTRTLTITNAYSHLINPLDDYGAGFTFINRWGIYQAGASDDNYFAGKLINTYKYNRQTASYTLVLADRSKLVEMNVATANNLTIPLDSSVAFEIGTQIEISQYGAGQTTIVATSGVTIRSESGNLKIAGQYVAVTLLKIGTNEWYCFGNLTA